MEIIKTLNLKKSFNNVNAIDGISLEVQEGEIYGIVGPDGAGKTTLIRLLTSILVPTEGEVWIDNCHTVKEAEAVKEKIGYMSQRFGLYLDLTVLENIQFYADLYGIKGKAREEKLEELLAFSNLSPFKHRLAQNLSGGMKQKLGLACALVHKPKVLFLDEPTNGVDPVSRRDFWNILNALHAQKTTIFVSTSYLDEAERFERVSMIHKGKIIATGTPEEIKTMQALTILEVKVADPRSIVTDLRDAFSEEAVRLFGGRIHISVKDAQEGIDKITAILKKHRIGHYEIVPSPPTLEDVFISRLTGETSK